MVQIIEYLNYQEEYNSDGLKEPDHIKELKVSFM